MIQNPSTQSNIILKEYDIVKVMSKDDFHDSYFVSVFGSVRNPGKLTFGKGMKLSESLIELSGGLKLESSGSRIEVSKSFRDDSDNLTPKRSVAFSFID